MRQLLLGLAALLACGVIAAGCGDDDDDNGDDSPAATESAPADTTSSDSTDEDADSVEEAVKSCKEGVQASAAQLSAEVRGDLEDLCDKAASGDEEEVREASLEICKKVIEETVPEGAGRDQALESCENAVP